MAAGPPPAVTVALTVFDESVAEYPETESVNVAVAVLLMIVPGGGVSPCASAAKPSSMPAIRNSCSGRIMTVPAYETGAGEVTQTPPPHRLWPLLRIDLHAKGHYRGLTWSQRAHVGGDGPGASDRRTAGPDAADRGGSRGAQRGVGRGGVGHHHGGGVARADVAHRDLVQHALAGLGAHAGESVGRAAGGTGARSIQRLRLAQGQIARDHGGAVGSHSRRGRRGHIAAVGGRDRDGGRIHGTDYFTARGDHLDEDGDRLSGR